MKSYRELEVYKESKQLAVDIHKMTLSLPKFEMFEEGSQIRRSAKAVTTAIVEGYGRKRYKLDFIKFLVYSQAECDETIIHLDFIYETGSLIDKTVYDNFFERYTILSKKINNYIQWVEENWNNLPSSKA